MVLSLCGPQSLDDLQTLGTRFGLLLASGDPTAQALPPRLLQRAEPAAVRVDDRLDLLFAHEHLPEGTEAALELLLACLGDNRPGGWLAICASAAGCAASRPSPFMFMPASCCGAPSYR